MSEIRSETQAATAVANAMPEDLNDAYDMLRESAPDTKTQSASWHGPALAAAGMAAAGALWQQAAQAQGGSQVTYADIPGEGDFKVLNYALVLEALEANFYIKVIERLTALGVGANELDLAYAQRFGEIERQHRDFLNGALGANSILQNPNFSTLSFDFSVLNSLDRQGVNLLLLDVERTGVNAYLGAIPRFSENSPFLQTAAAIQGTEARHTAILIIINNILFNGGRNTSPVPGEISAPAGNTIEATGRELLAITNAAPGQFVPQPAIPSTPENVVQKVAPFIKL